MSLFTPPSTSGVNDDHRGLEASLGMTGEDYNVALVVFFIPYVRTRAAFRSRVTGKSG